jgi:hypothetical protein
LFETGIEDGVESGGVDSHGGDECSVTMDPVEACPRRPETRVGEQALASEVLSTGTPVPHRPRVILVGPHNDDSHQSACPVEGFILIGFKLTVGGIVEKEEEVVVVHD